MNPLQTIVLVFGLVITVLVGLFPPWASTIAGNGYPPVPYRWIFSATPVVNGQVCRVDASRLTMRIGIVFGATGILFLAAGLLSVGEQHQSLPGVYMAHLSKSETRSTFPDSSRTRAVFCQAT